MVKNARVKLEQALQETETRLAKNNKKNVELQFERASLLAMLGQTDLAKQCYLEILHQDPTHFGTLNNLGTLLYETSYWDAARTIYQQAVICYPEKPIAHVNLANLLFYKGEIEAARKHYENALKLNPHQASAHQGLSAVFMELGDENNMRHHRELGYKEQPLKTYPYRGNEEPIPLLLLVASLAGGDLPWRRLVDDSVFSVTTLVAAFYDKNAPLPPHEAVFNTVSDADLCEEDLKAAELILKNTKKPLLNRPEAVLLTGRIANSLRLGDLKDVRAPRTLLISRLDLEKENAEEILRDLGFTFPLLLRSPGFHTGKHFIRVDLPSDLMSSVALLPGKSLFVIEYFDASGHDGCARKYRVMFVDGELYPYHLAISNHWKVHYFTAAMKAHKEHQAEEAAFLNNMPVILGNKGMAALKSISEKLNLDFAGIDFGMDKNGNILLFEANATMLIKPPDSSNPEWHYRLGAIDQILKASHRMLLKKVKSVIS